MKKTALILLLAVLGLGVVLTTGCPAPDDDDVGDDDDVVDDDDSSEADDDDDTIDPAGISFSVSMTVVPPDAARDDDDDSAADDDDSAGDDDDSAGDDDDSAGDDDDVADDDDAVDPEAYEVTADFTFVYWEDMEAGVGLCDQHIQIEGEAIFGFGSVDDGSCNNCTGRITFDPATATDVSNPAADPDHCDPAELQAATWDFGMLLLQEAGTETSSGTAWGDFLDLAMMDAASMEGLGLDAAVSGGSTAPELQADLADYGLVLSQLALTNNVAGSLGADSGLDGVANNAGGASTWYFYYYLFRNPEQNPHEGTDMVGEYGGQGFWVITFAQE